MADIHFGLETEYGITRQNAEGIDVVAESIDLVKSAKASGIRLRWDYHYEDPHQDARGFRVKELKQDFDEANYFAQDAARTLTFGEIKSDLVLINGARFYNDHAHPEYCTPECRSLLQLVQQDYIGDQLLMNCAQAINKTTDNPVMLYKNNTDFQGHSYGCHENYLIPRELPWETLAQGIQAFFVTRQLFCGAGKYGWEGEDKYLQSGFQISQRSDFFSELQSVDTMQRRPIVNTRDEPHADEDKWRRFHVIIGDANLSPYATWLKVGTTALVINCLINGAKSDEIPQLDDPLHALKSLSRDPYWKWIVRTADGRTSNAIAVQRRYLELARRYGDNMQGDWLLIFEAWEKILDDLENNPISTSDRLDWAAKYKLIESFRETEKISDDSAWLRSLDLEYHRLDQNEGLYYALLEQGTLSLPYAAEEFMVDTIISPRDTRAAIRGACIEKFGSRIISAQWDCVRIEGDVKKIELNLRDLFDVGIINQGTKLIKLASKAEDLEQLPFASVI